MAARHHTVPQFYLRNFADESDRVVLVDRDDPTRSHKCTVRKAVAEVGFYRIETADLAAEEDRTAHDPERVEAGLSQLEAEMAPAVQTLVDGRFDEFNEENWYRLIQFVAVQTVRGQRWRNDFTAMATQSMRVHVLSNLDDETARKWLAREGKPHGPADVAAFRERIAGERFPRLVAPQAVLVQESLKMALGDPNRGNRGLGQYLALKNLELIRPAEVAVLTSDEPVCWWSPGDGPVGYVTADVVWVPLSRQLILQFRNPALDPRDHGLPDLNTREGHDAMATEVNRLLAAQAERWIVHHPGDEPLAKLDLPPRTMWGDELAEVHEEGGVRREIYVHRRLTPDS